MPEEKRTRSVRNGAAVKGNAAERRNVAAEGGDVAVSGDDIAAALNGAAADETDIVASAAAAWSGGANGHGPHAAPPGEDADGAAPVAADDAAPAADGPAAADRSDTGTPVDGIMPDETALTEALDVPPIADEPAAGERDAVLTDDAELATAAVRRPDTPRRAVPERFDAPKNGGEFAETGASETIERFADTTAAADGERVPDAAAPEKDKRYVDTGEQPRRPTAGGAAEHLSGRMPGGAAHRVAPGRTPGPRVQRPPVRRQDAPAQAPRRSAPAPAKSGRKKRKSRRDVGETNLLIIKICLAAGLLLALALVIISVVMVQRGKKAEQYANQLLQAYQEKQSTATPAIATDTPDATESASPAPTDTAEPAASTDPQADAEAMTLANEHAFDDDSAENVDETADYVQPDAPDEHEAEKIIASVVSKVGEDGIIGVLKIPVINVELPVIGKWSYSLLKISVCRYKGPAANAKGNLVIIGHNYKSGAHFGNLDQLKVGSAVYLTDTNSNRVRYEVYDMDTIEPDSFSALNDYKGKAGLTLMTCKNSGNSRLVVRCVQKDAVLPGPR